MFIVANLDNFLVFCLQGFIICRYKMETRSSGYSCCVSAGGILYACNDISVTKREPPVWLTFIGIFFRRRVMMAALRIGLAAYLINRYEHFGLMCCFSAAVVCFIL